MAGNVEFVVVVIRDVVIVRVLLLLLLVALDGLDIILLFYSLVLNIKHNNMVAGLPSKLARRMNQFVDCMLHVACCMLHVACCMLHVACCMKMTSPHDVRLMGKFKCHPIY